MRKNFWLLISITLLSCSEDAVVPELGLDYYPIELGDYRIYDVQETTYLNFVATTETYQLRESFIQETINQSVSSFLLRIEKRSTSLDQWELHSTVFIRQTNYILEYRENNIAKVAMSYPVKIGRSWNGNGLNNDFEEVYRYALSTDADQIKVVISDFPPNLVERDQRSEIYQQGIGLVERNFTRIVYCQSGCSTELEPENGQILFQELIEYGSF